MTFTQKMLWKMTRDRRPLLTTFADKISVRDYVADTVGAELLTRLYAVVTDPAELDLARLPATFVVKPNHASGLIWIVAGHTLPLGQGSSESPRPAPGMFTTTRDALDMDLLVATCRKWLKTNYADVELEWAYRNIPPQILVEELLLDAEGQIPPDYKFFVFHGRVRLVQVDTDRFDGHRRNLFLPDWSPVDAQWIYPSADHEPLRPDSLDRMIHIAEVLGHETDFVRVDLFDVAGRVVFGELTSYPEGPYAPPFSPESFDAQLGRYWSLPQRYG
jgi:hypothetical protein